MKKIILSTILFLASMLSYAGNPPAAVQKAFKEKFAAATSVKWLKENSTEWEAEFIMQEVKVSANFKNNGAWVETETAIAVTDIPANITTAIKIKYKGSTITGAYKIETAGHGTKYEADIKLGNKKKEVIYKADGTFVK